MDGKGDARGVATNESPLGEEPPKSPARSFARTRRKPLESNCMPAASNIHNADLPTFLPRRIGCWARLKQAIVLRKRAMSGFESNEGSRATPLTRSGNPCGIAGLTRPASTGLLLDEQHFLVGRQRPEVVGHPAFQLVGVLADHRHRGQHVARSSTRPPSAPPPWPMPCRAPCCSTPMLSCSDLTSSVILSSVSVSNS